MISEGRYLNREAFGTGTAAVLDRDLLSCGLVQSNTLSANKAEDPVCKSTGIKHRSFGDKGLGRQAAILSTTPATRSKLQTDGNHQRRYLETSEMFDWPLFCS